jgi:hypothetical protein
MKTKAIFLGMLFLFLTACGSIPREFSPLSEKGNDTSTPHAEVPSPTTKASPTITLSTTPTITLTATLTSTPAPSATPTKISSPTPTPDNILLTRLSDMGILHTITGEYHRINDFDENWAQIDWYQWWRTDYAPENFVIRVDASWESASMIANWENSGCGIIFSDRGVNDHSAVFLTMDGYVRTHKYKGGYLYQQQGGYFGKFDVPSDSAELIVVVENQWLTVLVNGEQVVHYQDVYIAKGYVALSLVSGTNKDFGTRCSMQNIDFWDISG